MNNIYDAVETLKKNKKLLNYKPVIDDRESKFPFLSENFIFNVYAENYNFV